MPSSPRPAFRGKHSASEIAALLQELATSGQSAAAFARSRGIPVWKLYRPRRTAQRSRPRRSSSLIPVRVVAAPPSSPGGRIFVAREATDLRNGRDGLAGEDPQSGHPFVFLNRRRDRMKALVWDGSGFWLLYKRIEHGGFPIFDRASQRASFELTSSELALMLDGIDLRGSRRLRTHEEMMKHS